MAIRQIHSDIHDLYLNDAAKYEKESNKKLKIQRIYNMVPSFMENKKNGEVDYLIDDPAHLSTMPIEVKSGKDYAVHSALNKFLGIKDYNIKKAYVVSNEYRIFTDGAITYMPIYNIMFLQPESGVIGEW